VIGHFPTNLIVNAAMNLTNDLVTLGMEWDNCPAFELNAGVCVLQNAGWVVLDTGRLMIAYCYYCYVGSPSVIECFDEMLEMILDESSVLTEDTFDPKMNLEIHRIHSNLSWLN